MSRQWTLPLEISEFKADDYGKLAHVFGSIFPDYDRTPEEWRFDHEKLEKFKVHFKTYSRFSPAVQDTLGFVPGLQISLLDQPREHRFDILVDLQHHNNG